MMWQLINKDDYLALATDWSADWGEPIEARTVYKFLDVKWDENSHPKIFVEMVKDGILYVTKDNTPFTINLYAHQIVTLTERKGIAKPRNGKNYSWVWRNGAWRRFYND